MDEEVRSALLAAQDQIDGLLGMVRMLERDLGDRAKALSNVAGYLLLALRAKGALSDEEITVLIDDARSHDFGDGGNAVLIGIREFIAAARPSR